MSPMSSRYPRLPGDRGGAYKKGNFTGLCQPTNKFLLLVLQSSTSVFRVVEEKKKGDSHLLNSIVLFITPATNI